MQQQGGSDALLGPLARTAPTRDLAVAVVDAVDPSALMQRVCDRTLEVITAADGVAIGLCHEEGITYVCGAGIGAASVGTRVTLDRSLSGLAVRTGEIQRSDDTQVDPRVDGVACKALSVVSLVCIPMTRAGEPYGVMAVNASRTHAFTDDDVAMLRKLAEFVGVAVGSARDLDRASSQLVHLEESLDNVREHDGDDETTDRFVMGVLDPAAVTRIDARRQIERVLRDPRAVSIVVQPIVDLHSREVIAVEALARFAMEPVRSPDVWFAAAHVVGLGVDLELLAIRQALALRSVLPADVALNINVGPATVVDPRLSQLLAGVDPRGVVLELTEHTAFDDAGLQTALEPLRRSGVRLAVDDAGSGYSSLTHILRFAPDYIKLDRELISGIDLDPVRRALVTSLVAFAAETGAEIVAEGLESSDELDAVRCLGARYAQGYHLGRPAPLAAIDLGNRQLTTNVATWAKVSGSSFSARA